MFPVPAVLTICLRPSAQLFPTREDETKESFPHLDNFTLIYLTSSS